MVHALSLPRRAAGTLALAALLALSFHGAARADTEPNDNIVQAEGPLVSGKAYTGTTPTGNDIDYYYLYAPPQTQLKVNVTAPSSCRIYAAMTDGNGENGYELPNTTAYPSTTETLSYTTPPLVVRMFLSVSSNCTTQGYTFQLETNQTLTSGPSLAGAITPIPEPNENAAQAWGPMTGGQYYGAAFDTSNDQDWAYFYTAAGSQAIDISVINVSSDCDTFGTKLNIDGTEIESKDAKYGRVAHYTLTSPASARYELGMTSGCGSYLGQGLQWRVEPASAVSPVLVQPVVTPKPKPTATAKPRASYACRQARAATSRAAKRYSAAKRRMNRARTTRAYNRARRQVKVRKTALRKARARQARRC